MNDAEKEALELLRIIWTRSLVFDEYTADEDVKLIAQALQKKQDEIEQYKTQWQNAEDSNIKLSEKILEYRKEIERLKKCDVCGGTDLVCGKGWMETRDKLSEEISAQSQEIERLTKKLREAEQEIKARIEFSQSDFNRKLLTDQIQSLTARNKELEVSVIGIQQGGRNIQGEMLKKIKELEGYIEDFKKSEKAFLETINQQGDEIKELKLALSGRTVSCEACNGMAEKVKELGDKNFKMTEELTYWYEYATNKNDGSYLGLKCYKNLTNRISELESKLAALREAYLLVTNDKEAPEKLGEKP